MDIHTALFEVVLPKPLRRSALFRALATSIANWTPAKPTPRGAHLESLRVLVVDDSVVNQKVVQELLAKLLTGPTAFDLRGRTACWGLYLVGSLAYL